MMDLLLAVLGRGDAPPVGRLAPAEWDGLLDVACQHRASPLLWHRLQERGEPANPPDAVRRRLSALHVVDSLRADARRLQLTEALAALRARGVPVVILKGAYLAEHAYPSPALRPMGDVDLLVPEHSFDAAVEALTCVGYTPPDDESRAAYRNHRHPPPLKRRGYLTIELHTRIEPCTPPFRLATGEVWRRAHPVQSAGECALALAPEDLLLHLATHMGHSHLLGTSLISAYDVAVWMDRFGATADWDAIVRRATESRTQRFVHVALGLAHAAFATPRPCDEVRQALRRECDEAAIAEAMHVLHWPRRFPDGALGLLTARPSFWGGVRRMARLLVVEPLNRRHQAAPGSNVQGADVPGADVQGADVRGAHVQGTTFQQWTATARFLLDPASRRALRRQTARIRLLRRWALEGC